MKLNEIIYNGVVFAMAMLLVCASVAEYFILVQDPATKSRAFFCFAITWQSIVALLLATTSIINFIRKELVFAATIIQIIGLIFSIWFSPLVIWAIIALVLKSRRGANKSLQATAAGPASCD